MTTILCVLQAFQIDIQFRDVSLLPLSAWGHFQLCSCRETSTSFIMKQQLYLAKLQPGPDLGGGKVGSCPGASITKGPQQKKQ